ncbi:unnamed protein product [Schistosoma mattheei]|uniref:Uncharacterized protein n=1 Tax=Schistosoma mattheei TaxID=31246 RepID=A0A3P8DZT8_9TREM|nr:unnamed protein product [Schistosoma mattheei]
MKAKVSNAILIRKTVLDNKCLQHIKNRRSELLLRLDEFNIFDHRMDQNHLVQIPSTFSRTHSNQLLTTDRISLSGDHALLVFRCIIFAVIISRRFQVNNCIFS